MRKQILLDTAIAYGAEDNTFGHGLVNAYEAVLGAVSAAGATRVSGVVRDPDGAPLPEASVTIDPGYAWTTSATGRFGGFAQAGDYSVTVEHELLQTRSLGVRHLEVGLPFDLDVTLQDRSGPVVRDLSLRDAVEAVGDSLEIRATLADFSGTTEARLWMRRDDASGSEAWRSLPMEPRGGNWSARFPLDRFGDEFSYYIESSDRIGNVALHPAGGSAAPLHGSYLRLVFEDDAEEDRGWSLVSAGDTPYGHWIRLDPFGTSYLGTPIEPADDHSEPGTACFVTGKGRIDAPPGASDVDDGCVTLTSPLFDLSDLDSATLSYWRWFAAVGDGVEGASLVVDATADSGATWITLERIGESAAAWVQSSISLEPRVPLSAQVRFRFTACDLGADVFVEAAVDDVVLRGRPRPASVPQGAGAVGPRFVPNPTRRGAAITLELAEPEAVTLEIYDPEGRQIFLAEGLVPGGESALEWDGNDRTGKAVAPGVYLYRVRSDREIARGKLLVVR
ncbi:MAG: carboxypeptidase regulatory-like domain-containing protein [Candidatus Eisenbacteria bacterium]